MNHLKLITLVVLLVYSTISSSQNTSVQLEPHSFKSHSGEIIEAELGTFSVPENRLVATSRTIALSFVRFKSTNPNPGNPIVYLAGGPGGSGINTAKGPRFELFMALREVADVIAFDQRGTGISNHISVCSTSANIPIDEPGRAEVYVSKMANAAKTCIQFWKDEGVEIEGYTTVENANDLEDLRKVLGVPKINLWGISYGSHLAFDFIKRYENSVDKVVLAGLEGPNETIKLPQYNQNFLKTLNAKIQEDPTAAKAYPDLLKLMDTVLTRLEKQPVFVEITEPRSGRALKVGISKLDVQLVTSYLLTKNPKDSAKLPFMYQQMLQGNFSNIAQMVAGIKAYSGRIQAMPLVMDAASGVSKKRWKAIVKQSQTSLLGRTTNFPYPDMAFGLGLPDLGDAFRENPVSSVDALFFSGTLDGRTYLESAKTLIKGFKNAKHIIIDGGGHDVFMSTPKIKALMLDFFHLPAGLPSRQAGEAGNKKIVSQTIKIEMPKFVVKE